jgi:hypothetical protein
MRLISLILFLSTRLVSVFPRFLPPVSIGCEAQWTPDLPRKKCKQLPGIEPRFPGHAATNVAIIPIMFLFLAVTGAQGKSNLAAIQWIRP